MDPSYAERSLNVGFSGGEKKKAEILQLMMLKPNLAILDETDSGLDVDAVRLVSKGVEEYQKDRDGALLIITHSTRILESLHVDYTHVMVNGHIVATGDGSLVDRINEEGYESFVSEAEEVKRTVKEKTYVEDIDRSMYDFRNEEKDAYKVKRRSDSGNCRTDFKRKK